MNKTFLSFSFYLIALIFLAGCTSLNVSVFHPRVDVPEVNNDSGLGIYLGGLAAHEYTSTQDASVRPPNLNNPVFEDRALLGLGLDFRVANQIRLGVESSLVASQLKAQWQFLGGGSESAEGWVGSVSVGLGLPAGGSKSGDQDGVFGPGGNPWKGEVSTSGYWGSLSLGKRLSESFLGFAGVGSGSNEVRTKIEQSPGGAGSNPPGTYTASDRGSQFTWGLGFIWGQSTSVLVKYEGTQVRYQKAKGPDSINTLIIGVAF